MSNIQQSINKPDKVTMALASEQGVESKRNEPSDKARSIGDIKPDSEIKKDQKKFHNVHEHPTLTQKVVEGFRKWTFGETENDDISDEHNNLSNTSGAEPLQSTDPTNSDRYMLKENNFYLSKNSKDLQDAHNNQFTPMITKDIFAEAEFEGRSVDKHSGAFKYKNSASENDLSKDYNGENHALFHSGNLTTTKNYEQQQKGLILPEPNKSLRETEKAMKHFPAGNSGKSGDMKVENFSKTTSIIPETIDHEMKPKKYSTEIPSDEYAKRMNENLIEQHSTMDPWKNKSNIGNQYYGKDGTQKPSEKLQFKKNKRTLDHLGDSSSNREGSFGEMEESPKDVKSNSGNMQPARNVKLNENHKVESSRNLKHIFGHKEKPTKNIEGTGGFGAKSENMDRGEKNNLDLTINSNNIDHSNQKFVPENERKQNKEQTKMEIGSDDYDHSYVGTVDKNINSQSYGLSNGPYITKNKENSTSYKQNENLMHSKKEILLNYQDDIASLDIGSDGRKKKKKNINPNTNLNDVQDNHAARLSGSGDSQDAKHDGKVLRRSSIKDKILNVFGLHKKKSSTSEEDHRDYRDQNENYLNTNPSGISQQSVIKDLPKTEMDKNLNSTVCKGEETKHQKGIQKHSNNLKAQRSENFQSNNQGAFESMDNHNDKDFADENFRNAADDSYCDTENSNTDDTPHSNHMNYHAGRLSGPSLKRHKQSNSINDNNEANLQQIRDQQNERLYKYQDSNKAGNYTEGNIPRSSQVPADMQAEKVEDKLNYISTSNANVYAKDV